MGNLHGLPRHLSTQPAKLNIMMSSAQGFFSDELRDKGPREWAEQTLIIIEEAMEAYLVEVIAESLY